MAALADGDNEAVPFQVGDAAGDLVVMEAEFFGDLEEGQAQGLVLEGLEDLLSSVAADFGGDGDCLGRGVRREEGDRGERGEKSPPWS